MIEVLPLTNCQNYSNLIQIGIPSFTNKHYVDNELIGIYYINVENNSRFYYNINHPDWTRDKADVDMGIPHISVEKKLLVKSAIKAGIDANFLLSPTQQNIKFIDFIPSKFKRYFYNQNRLQVLPLVKLFEICEHIYNTMDKSIYLNKDRIDSATKMDKLFYESLYKTESNVIIKNDEKYPYYYSDYNPYTITSRPTNSSGGINFTALSKKDDTRKHIIAGDGHMLVQFDYTAFHPYLISKILGIEIPKNVDYYSYLNEKFNFSVSDSRDHIKEDFFKLIYGYNKSQNEFSDKIAKFEQQLLEEYQGTNSIKTFFLKRQLFLKGGLNGNVLFNYFLQNMETEYNMLKLTEILATISDKDAELMLYIYDSFIFKIEKNNREIVSKLEKILVKEGFPVKIYIGQNLQDLQLIN